jgi:hypothetical protein
MYFLTKNIRINAKHIKNQQRFLHISWISRHSNILENEKVNSLIKSTLFLNIITSDQFTSFKFLKNRVLKLSLTQWRAKWARDSNKKKHYQNFDIKSKEEKIKLLSNRFDKLTISTLMQMNFEHEFLKAYLIRLLKYDSKNCNENCNKT